MAYPRQSTRKQRSRWYYQVYKCGKSVKEVCAIFGISRKCYYYWYNKDIKDGRSYHSKKRQPNIKLTDEIKRFIEKEKMKTNYGPLKMKYRIKQEFDVDVSTTIIYRFYKKKMLIRKPQRKLPWYEPMKKRLIIAKPGQGVQFDIKYIYPNGKRKYLFSVFDPYTEQYYFWIADTKHSYQAITAFKGAEEYFGFKILSVQTDNGSEFRGEFHSWLTKKNILHYFIPKKSPWWNSQVERVHKTIDDEYYLNPYRVWKTPYEWLHYYNYERIHLTLDGLTPKQYYKNCVTLDC